MTLLCRNLGYLREFQDKLLEAMLNLIQIIIYKTSQFYSEDKDLGNH